MTKPAPNLQEIYDTVARHLLKQGRKSIAYAEEGMSACVYRAPDGCKCAIGALIRDEDYIPGIEGKSIYDYVVQRQLPFSVLGAEFFLDKLQQNLATPPPQSGGRRC